MQIESIFERRRFVFLDGGMGTQLQQRGLQPGQKPELAALEMPEILTAIHADYAAAGADLLLANTFGANARKLAGTGYSVAQVVEASLACARRGAASTGALVGLDIGPWANCWLRPARCPLPMPTRLLQKLWRPVWRRGRTLYFWRQ